MLHSEKDLDKPYPEVYGLVHSMACFLTFKAFGLFDTAERNEPDLHPITYFPKQTSIGWRVIFIPFSSLGLQKGNWKQIYLLSFYLGLQLD